MAVIHTRNLAKTYSGRKEQALRGVDVDLLEGRVLGILGSNGAGKTTLIRLLTTLSKPTSGTASVCGFDVTTQGAQVRERIALVGQSAAVDEVLSGRANLVLFGRLRGLSPRRARERASELLERMGLTEAANRAVKDYSGGMRRKLDLAVALVTDPDVLFVDEPTTGLDPISRRALWGLVRQLVDGGRSVVLTTQYLEEADALADDIVILRDGAVIASGTSADLKRLAGPPRTVTLEPTLEEVYLRLHSDTDDPTGASA